MDISAHTGPNILRSKNNGGFSLIEVALAVGVLGFGLLATFGLIPVGMSTFHQAVNTSIGAQVVQHVINDARQADFTALLTGSNNQAITAATGPGYKAARYFDNQGNELTTPANSIYEVNTVVTPQTTLPTATQIGTLATVTVQIATNPGHVPMTSGTNNLWTNPAINITTYSAMVAQDK